MAINIGPRIGIDGEAEYRKQINNIIQQTRTLKSEYDKVTAAGDKNSTSLKKNAEQRKILNQQIQVQEERVKACSAMLVEAEKKQNNLDLELVHAKSVYGENSDEVKALTSEYQKSEDATLKWQEQVNKATTELNNLQSKLQELPSNLELVGQKMQDMGDKIKGVGQGMTNLGQTFAPVSAAAAAGLTASGKAFMDFEAGMSKVAAISGATGDDLAALTEKAKDMGATTKFSASESAEAFSYMAMAGWKTEQMLDGIAPIMNLAAASGEDLALTSDIVTDALTAFGLKAQDAGMFTDVLAAASSNSNTNVAMMGESFKYAAQEAGSMGYSIQDTALALGLMANNGIKADMAGTALRNIIQRMAKPTKESQMAMDRLGISLADDEGHMYSLRQIMDKLRGSFGQINMPMEQFDAQMELLIEQLENGELTEKKFGDATDELIQQAYGAEAAEKARAAAMLAGARAMPALLAVVNSTAEDYDKLATAIDGASEPMAKLADGSIVPLSEAMASGQEIIEQYNGTAEEMARIMQDNAAGAWVEAKSAMEGAAITAGKVLAPYIKQAAEEVKDLANWFQSLDSETQETIVKTTALVAAISPLLIIGGKVTTGIGSLVSGGGKLLSFIGQLTPALGTASGALSATGSSAAAAGAGIAGIAAPVAVAVGALALLAGAFVTAYKNDEEFASEVDKSWAEIKKSITDVINTVKPLWDEFSATLAPVFVAGLHMINSEIQNFKDYLQGFINFVAGIFSGDWKRALSGAEQMTAGTVNHIISRFEFMRDSIAGIFRRANFEFPKIKLPHIRVSGEWSLNPPSAPSFSVDWYSKAMANGIRLTSPTIFGAMGNKLLGGGEAGPEWVVGENSLMGMIHSAVRGGHGDVSIGDTNIIINADGQDAEEIANRVDEIITMRLQQAEAAWA
ncbi:MAG: phage tail tape measure protein [Lachnospiraceae bacterium]|nr:phage tail tape measure protein [Lachnospiraceae bacterium]